MKPLTSNSLTRSVIRIAVAALAATGASQAQAQASPPTASAMVSHSGADNAEGAIEPRKPSITQETTDDSIAVDPTSLLPDLPPVPKANATLVGGTIAKLDRVRDKVVVSVFGGGKMSVFFDPRTIVYRGGKEASIADLQPGDRIYLDTILDGSTVFARTIRLQASRASGQSQGVVVKYRADRNELTMRDSISPNTIRVRISSSTQVLQGGHAVAASTLTPGALISITFSPEGDGHDAAREISILALPGQHFTFTGEVVHLDLRTGLLVVKSATDNKTYDVYLGPSITPDENLHAGAAVTADTDFDGSRYVARDLKINSH